MHVHCCFTARYNPKDCHALETKTTLKFKSTFCLYKESAPPSPVLPKRPPSWQPAAHTQTQPGNQAASKDSRWGDVPAAPHVPGMLPPGDLHSSLTEGQVIGRWTHSWIPQRTGKPSYTTRAGGSCGKLWLVLLPQCPQTLVQEGRGTHQALLLGAVWRYSHQLLDESGEGLQGGPGHGK